MTFGSSRQQPHVCELVRMGLASKDGTTKHLMLFAVPMICEPVSCQPISFCQTDFDHLTGIDLADSSDAHASLEVDILIRADQYWELVTGELRHGHSGPVAISMNLGWILSGLSCDAHPEGRWPVTGIATLGLQAKVFLGVGVIWCHRLRAFSV